MKVAIVGLSPSRREVPSDYEIWALPWDAEYASRAARLFEMHPRVLLEKPESLRSADYFDHLGKFPQPVYTQEHWSDVPTSTPYPLEELQETVFKGFPRWDQVDWYNSSPAYMLALAIHEGATTIGLFGIDILDDSEFAYERPCLEHLIGFARGRGIEIVIPEGPTALCQFRGTGIKLGDMSPTYHDRYGYL